MGIAVPHLTRIGRTYYFRQTVPPDLRLVLGKREIKRSLRTGNRTTATLRCCQLSTRMAAVVEETRAKEADLARIPQEDREAIRRIVDEIFRDELERDEERRATRRELTAEEAELEAQRHLRFAAKDEEMLARSDFESNFDFAYLGSFVNEYHLDDLASFDDGAVDSDGIMTLARELLKVQVQVAKIKAARSRGNYDSPKDPAGFVPVVQAFVGSPTEAKRPGKTLGELIGEYVADKMGAGSWNTKTKGKQEKTLRVLTEVLGKDCPADSIAYEDLRRVRDDYLRRLPARIGTIPKYRGKSLDAILGMPDIKPAATGTIRDSVGHVTSFFNWCYERNHLTHDPAKGLSPPKVTVRPDEQRAVFATEEIQKLLAALCAHRAAYRKNSEDHYWIVLLALFTGARLGELCQLYLEDITQIDGIWSISIAGDKEDQSLKNSASRRRVPLHPFLIARGFVDHVEAKRKKAPKSRLWPRLTYRKGEGYIRQVSRWFKGFKDKHVSDDSSLVFHSLRHTVATVLKNADVGDTKISELLGHKVESITTGRYGKRFNSKKMLEVVEQIDLGVDLASFDWPTSE